MAAAASALDEAVREYLVYRGFTNTLNKFELEKKDDKDKGFRVREALGSTYLDTFCHTVHR